MQEGTSAVLLQSVLDEKDSMEYFPICRKYKISCLMGTLHTKDVLENLIKDQSFRLLHGLSITLSLRKTSQESINLERKSYLDCSWNHRTSTPFRSETNGIAERAIRRGKREKEHQLFCCNPDWMISGGQIATCGMSKTSWQTGKLRMNEDLGNHLKDQFFRLVHWWNVSQAPRETQREVHQFGKKVLPGIFLGYAWGNLERRHSDC